MMLTGKNVRARKALKLGLVDKVVAPVWLIDEAKIAADLPLSATGSCSQGESN